MQDFFPLTKEMYKESVKEFGKVMETIVVEDIFMPPILELLREDRDPQLLPLPCLRQRGVPYARGQDDAQQLESLSGLDGGVLLFQCRRGAGICRGQGRRADGQLRF